MDNQTTPPIARDVQLSRTWFAALALCALGFVTAIIWVSFPTIDLTISSLFANGDGDGALRFNLRQHPIAKFLNDVIDEGGAILVMFVLLGLFITSLTRRPFVQIRLRQYWFLLLSLITGPGLVANALFKEYWGRARPRDVEFFGGDKLFTPPLMVTDQCNTNCSFVSGDASLAFTMLAFALVMPANRQRWVLLAVAFGILISVTRIVQGAHFPSDTLFAGIFMSLSILLVYMIVIEKRWGVSAVLENLWSKISRNLQKGCRVVNERLGVTSIWTQFGLTHRTASMDHAIFAKDEAWKQRIKVFFKASLEDVEARKRDRTANHND